MIQDYNFEVSYLCLLSADCNVFFSIKIPSIPCHLHCLLLSLALNPSELSSIPMGHSTISLTLCSATKNTLKHTSDHAALQIHLQWLGLQDHL